MLRSSVEQRVLDIGGVKVGGQPGEYPTVLIGSIFYQGHRIVENHTKGIFDRRKAEELILRQEELSEETGNPHMVDIVASTPEAMEKYIGFVSEVTDAPLLIDSTDTNVRIVGARYAEEVGLLDRVVYNSIGEHTGVNELNILKELGVKSTIVLAFTSKAVFPQKRLEYVAGKNGLLGKIASSTKIENILVDVGVLDVPSIGLALDTIKLVKEKIGLPAGCAPLNAVLEWRKVRRYGVDAKKACAASAAVAPILAGADFILYGPIKYAEIVFPACAMIDAIIAYTNRFRGIRPSGRNHPLYKIFK